MLNDFLIKGIYCCVTLSPHYFYEYGCFPLIFDNQVSTIIVQQIAIKQKTKVLPLTHYIAQTKKSSFIFNNFFICEKNLACMVSVEEMGDPTKQV